MVFWAVLEGVVRQSAEGADDVEAHNLAQGSKDRRAHQSHAHPQEASAPSLGSFCPQSDAQKSVRERARQF